ncbi:MAG: HD domain-containing protein [Desulfobacterales bacterium]|nr:HD domain-containing protein [Desulfobacterales bacterium]
MEKFDAQILSRIHADANRREQEVLSERATPSIAGLRRRPEPKAETDYRPAFSLDVDRVLHSRAYSRYIDKTQVFYLIQNDHITHRVLHVQLVSKIGRTIGRFLGLNEDLIEAVALGHDIGHTPFGHDGERILSELCSKHGLGTFQHNLQSVQFLEKVERKGTGWNLCLQTLDGILCHDGEVHNQELEPVPSKTFETFDREVSAKQADPQMPLFPMTLEGCVVRMADTISYVGRDLEDAIRLNMIRRTEIPKEVVRLLGETNGTIVYNLVTDVILNSRQKGNVSFSPEISDCLKRLKNFNLERIYLNPKIKTELDRIRTLFEVLFERYLSDIETDNRDSVIFRRFLSDMSEAYTTSHRKEEIVRDFVAGMTDQYFLRQCPEHLRPHPRPC